MNRLQTVLPVIVLVLSTSTVLAQGNKPKITDVPWVDNINVSVNGACPNATQVDIYKVDPPAPDQHLGTASIKGDGAQKRFEKQIGTNFITEGDTIKVRSNNGGNSVTFVIPPCPAQALRAPGGSPPPVPPCQMSFFDVMPFRPASIRGLQLNLATGVHTVRVYTRPSGGSYAGFQTSPTAWQELGTVTVVSEDAADDTAIPLSLSVALVSGQARGFALEIMNANALLASGVMASNPVVVQDDAIAIHGGALSSGHFTPSTAAGIFNGVIWYTAAPAAVPFQRNHGSAWLDIDGVESNGLLPASTGAGSGSTTTTTTGGNSTLWIAPLATGMPYDVAVAPGNLVAWPSFPALATPGSQVINIDLTSAGLFFLNSGTGVPGLATSSGTFTIPLPGAGGTTMGTATMISAQMFVLNPGSADGVTLSQGVEHGF